MTSQKPMVPATNGSGSLASRTKDIEALRLIGRATLNGHGNVFEFEGREVPFYGVPVADKYFWERAYGRVVEEDGHFVMETKVGSPVEGALKAERFMALGVWYQFAPSTNTVYVSEQVYGSRGPEIIQSQEEPGRQSR